MFYTINYTGSPWSHFWSRLSCHQTIPGEPPLTDQNGNSRPGTVVDRGVTAIYPFDFFLQGEKSNVYSSFFLYLISSSQYMSGFKERRNPRNTSSFMTRSDSRLTNSRILWMPSVTWIRWMNRGKLLLTPRRYAALLVSKKWARALCFQVSTFGLVPRFRRNLCLLKLTFWALLTCIAQQISWQNRAFAELYPIGGFSTRRPEVILASHLIRKIKFLKAQFSLGECGELGSLGYYLNPGRENRSVIESHFWSISAYCDQIDRYDYYSDAGLVSSPITVGQANIQICLRYSCILLGKFIDPAHRKSRL